MDQRFPGNKDVDFDYERTPPTKDLISYKDMMLEMNHWAATDSSCLSLAVIGFFILVGIGVLSVVFNSLFFK